MTERSDFVTTTSPPGRTGRASRPSSVAVRFAPPGEGWAQAAPAGDELGGATVELETIDSLKAKGDVLPDRRSDRYHTLPQEHPSKGEDHA